MRKHLNVFSLQQGAFVCDIALPMADGNELHRQLAEQLLFPFPYAVREVCGAFPLMEKRALAASGCEPLAFSRQVAYAGGAPKVVHNPKNPFP